MVASRSEEKMSRLDSLIADATAHSKELRDMFEDRDKKCREFLVINIKQKERVEWLEKHHNSCN